MTRLYFENKTDTGFATALRERVDTYFRQKECGRKGNLSMLVKLIIIFFLFAGSYGMILSNAFSTGTMAFLAILFGCSMAMIAFNVSHDAAHGAIANAAWINHVLSYSFNVIGLNRYIWAIKHNHSHHGFTNIPFSDVDIEHVRFARLHKYHPGQRIFRYQHIYLPLLWAFFGLHLVFIKDFMLFSCRQFGNRALVRHPLREYAILIASKLFFVGFTIVVPLIVVKLPWQTVLAGVLLMFVCSGYLLAVILIPVHLLDDCAFPEPDGHGRMSSSWMRHQLETTCDFASGNRILTWCCGAANLHIAHHLFPGVCHIHYHALTGIIKCTAAEYGLVYRNKTFLGALGSHLRYLRRIGRSGQVPELDI